MAKFQYTTTVKVTMDSKYIGDIRPWENGYAFFPKGSKIVGDMFPTIALVIQSIEAP